MTNVPYPSFRACNPVDATANRAALVAAGRCRIHPEHVTDHYRAIVAKTVDQAHVSLDNDSSLSEKEKKQQAKRYMKEAVALAKHFLEQELQLDVSVIDVEVFVDANDLIETDGCLASCLLDAGCQTIVTDGTNLEALEAAKIPSDRLMGHFVVAACSGDADLVLLLPSMERAKTYCDSVSVQIEQSDDISESALLRIMNKAPLPTVVMFQPKHACNDGWLDDDNDLARLVGHVCREATRKNNGSTVSLIDPSACQLGLSYAACITTDREDGLFTTVVCTRTGEALGLVYSSKESIVAAMECGRGVYYSRSRQQLWRKGDTSGHFQTLHRLDLDCDGDALRFTVTQRGDDDQAAFCHLNTLTCWGKPRGLRHLEETLQDRLKSAPEGSYTKRLFEDSDLLRDKLVEEAQELTEANDPQHVAEELADVLYFAMVRAAKAGVSIDDAACELDKRARKVTRRKGDSKAFRIAAGKGILEKGQQGEAEAS